MRTMDPLQFFGETGNENDVTDSIFWEDKYQERCNHYFLW
jgi:hypothetical protein